MVIFWIFGYERDCLVQCFNDSYPLIRDLSYVKIGEFCKYGIIIVKKYANTDFMYTYLHIFPKLSYNIKIEEPSL